jgi:TolA-binding protein
MAACGGGASHQVQIWSDEFLAAARFADNREFGEAEVRFQTLAAQAPSPERTRQALFELARIAHRQGQLDEALQRYEVLWRSEIRDSTGGRALHESARIMMRELDRIDEGLVMHRQVIERYPDHVAAEFSLEELRRHYQRLDGHDDLLELLEALIPSVSGTVVGHQVLLLTGEMYESHRKDEARALELYHAVHMGCPRCAVGDDGLWKMVLIYERHQNWSAALPLLEFMANRTESSWFVGTYNSPRASDARHKLGLIQMLFLRDYGTARRNFNQFLKDFPHSFEADDVAWHIVQSYRLEGDERRYLREKESFVRSYPDSRLARQREGQR